MSIQPERHGGSKKRRGADGGAEANAAELDAWALDWLANGPGGAAGLSGSAAAVAAASAAAAADTAAAATVGLASVAAAAASGADSEPGMQPLPLPLSALEEAFAAAFFDAQVCKLPLVHEPTLRAALAAFAVPSSAAAAASGATARASAAADPRAAATTPWPVDAHHAAGLSVLLSGLLAFGAAICGDGGRARALILRAAAPAPAPPTSPHPRRPWCLGFSS
jgi:hypothetical protein